MGVVQMLASELLLGSNRVVATGHIDYNFGEWRETGEEWPGLSAFYKDDAGDVVHPYSTFGRGVEVMMGTFYTAAEETQRSRRNGLGALPRPLLIAPGGDGGMTHPAICPSYL
jgi:hypothetical protein